MSKIIFSDLDGTLLDDKKQITPQNREAILRATKAGHSFVIATGRPFESARKVSDSLGLNTPGCYMVSYNGAHVYDCFQKKVLAKRTLSLELTRELFARADAAGLYIHTYQNEEILTKKATEELAYYASRTNLKAAPREDVLDHLTKEPCKLIVIHLTDHDRLVAFRESQKDFVRGKCRMLFSCPQYLEIVPEGVSKQTGIDFLSALLSVDPADTIAIGDETNDVEMIQAAKIGVAVANANPNVQKIADYVTKETNNGGAIAEVIERFVLA